MILCTEQRILHRYFKTVRSIDIEEGVIIGGPLSVDHTFISMGIKMSHQSRNVNHVNLDINANLRLVVLSYLRILYIRTLKVDILEGGLEAIGVAGFRKKLFGPFRVIAVSKSAMPVCYSTLFSGLTSVKNFMVIYTLFNYGPFAEHDRENGDDHSGLTGHRIIAKERGFIEDRK